MPRGRRLRARGETPGGAAADVRATQAAQCANVVAGTIRIAGEAKRRSCRPVPYRKGCAGQVPISPSTWGGENLEASEFRLASPAPSSRKGEGKFDLLSRSGFAAVDGNDLTRQERRLIGSQEHDGLGDFLRRPSAFERHARNHAAAPSVVSRPQQGRAPTVTLTAAYNKDQHHY